MDILKTKTVLALGLSSAVSIAASNAAADEIVSPQVHDDSTSIIAVSSPNLRVTVYDGIATLIGTADTVEEAESAEQEIRDVPGIDHVINLITWG